MEKKEMKFKKYPLFVSLIISFVIVLASIFVLAFCGLKLSTSLGGGSQMELAISDNAETKTYVQNIKDVMSSKGLAVDSCTVEDKVLAGEGNTEFTQRYIVVKILASNVNDTTELEVRTALAEKLGVSVSNISTIDNIVSSVKAKDILLLGLGIGVIAICLFVFGLIRYDVFAGLAFLLVFLHNIILYFSVIILTRIPLSLVSLAAISILTLVAAAILISIFERYKIDRELHLAEKETPSSRMIRVEKNTIKSYAIFLVSVVVFMGLLLFVPVTNVLFSAASVLMALIVSAYSVLIIGPAVYSSLLDIQFASMQASLSRNDNINKVIKKKKIESSKKRKK